MQTHRATSALSLFVFDVGPIFFSVLPITWKKAKLFPAKGQGRVSQIKQGRELGSHGRLGHHLLLPV